MPATPAADKSGGEKRALATATPPVSSEDESEEDAESGGWEKRRGEGRDIHLGLLPSLPGREEAFSGTCSLFRRW